MSLLMKALEKAAKDRVEARAETAAAAAPGKAELSLQPIAQEAPAAPRPEGAPPRPPAAAPAPAAREQAQAATVLQAAARPQAAGVGAYLRTHPILLLGTVAGLIAVGFGIYIYMQISRPGLFVRQPPTAPKAPLPPLAKASATAPQPLPAAPLLQPGAAEPATPGAAPAPREKPQAVAAFAPPPAEAPRNTIVVSPAGGAEPVINPLLTQAYAALEANRFGEAKGLYNQLLRAEPKTADALLGLAAIATLEGNNDEAGRLYLQILELDPRHALAQSGLIAILGRADPLSAESRLRQLIAREPSAFLYFTLGNLYADQSQWAAAQQVWFQAHHLEPANPDYAYNLAVGLEHVSQPKLALGFYRRAVQLAAAKGRSNFNLAQAQERISRLASQVE